MQFRASDIRIHAQAASWDCKRDLGPALQTYKIQTNERTPRRFCQMITNGRQRVVVLYRAVMIMYNISP